MTLKEATLLKQLQKKIKSKLPEHPQKGYCFIKKMLQHMSLWLQRLLCLTKILNWLITLLILLTWQQLQQQACNQEYFPDKAAHLSSAFQAKLS